MNTLVDDMQSLESADPKKVFAELYEFFLKIATLKIEEVFAAYQAIIFYEKHLPEPIGEYIKDLIESTKKALIDRAVTIYLRNDVSKRAGLAWIFARQLDDDYKFFLHAHRMCR